jgi:hypothetical protein
MTQRTDYVLTYRYTGPNGDTMVDSFGPDTRATCEAVDASLAAVADGYRRLSLERERGFDMAEEFIYVGE